MDFFNYRRQKTEDRVRPGEVIREMQAEALAGSKPFGGTPKQPDYQPVVPKDSTTTYMIIGAAVLVAVLLLRKK